jgi:predicted transcriptional regulator
LQQDSTKEWDLLSEYQKQHILKGLAEADAGLGTPAKEVTERTRKKYGLNS